MSNYTINYFSLLSSSEGFGFNTDIFETNVLNLAVVIGVLIYYGRIVLNDLIVGRKTTILKSLKEAEIKFNEAEKNLSLAKNNLIASEAKVNDIRNQTQILSKNAVKNLMDLLEEDIKRLQSVNLSYIRFEEEKSIGEVCENLSQSAFKIALEKLNKRLNSNLQKKIISQNLYKLNLKFYGKK